MRHVAIILLALVIPVKHIVFAEVAGEKRILDKYKNGNNQIRNGRGTIVWEFVIADSNSVEGKAFASLCTRRLLPLGDSLGFSDTKTILYTFEGNKKRYDYRQILTLPKEYGGGLFEVVRQRAFNGEKTDVYSLDRKYPQQLFNSRAQILNGQNMETCYDPRNCYIDLMNKVLDDNLEKVITETVVDKTVTQGQSESGMACDILSGKIANTDSTIKIYFAPELNYRPVKIEITDTKAQTFVNIDYKKYGGTYFVKKTTIENFIKRSSTTTLLYRQVYSVTDDFQINTKLDDNVFELYFPRGTQVWDQRNDQRYVVDNYEERK